MFEIVAKVERGKIKVGDVIDTFKIRAFAEGHYWVEKEWAYIREI